MKYEEACSILEVDCDKNYVESEIKRQYKLMSLKYHPDKNSALDACFKFHQVNEAYITLLEYIKQGRPGDIDDSSDDDYESVDVSGTSYTNPLWDSIYDTIYKEILELYNSNTWNIIESIDKTLLLKLYSFLCKNRKRFPHWGNVILHHIGLFLKITLKPMNEPLHNVKRYIIYPTLNDLLACNLYKHIENTSRDDMDETKKETFLVPCWMEESVFDFGEDGDEIIVNCIPVFPKDVWMDEQRNIHKFVQLSLSDLWNIPEEVDNVGSFDIAVGSLILSVRKDELLLLQNQVLIRRGCGIPIVNTTDVFDISKKSNVMIHIQITW